MAIYVRAKDHQSALVIAAGAARETGKMGTDGTLWQTSRTATTTPDLLIGPPTRPGRAEAQGTS